MNTTKSRRAVSIRCGQQAGRHEPEDHKGHPVEHGVLENHTGRGAQRSWISEPFENVAPNRAGVRKGLPHRRVNAKEPDGYRNGADSPSNHALGPIVCLCMESFPSCVTWVTADAPTSANAQIGERSDRHRECQLGTKLAQSVSNGERTTRQRTQDSARGPIHARNAFCAHIGALELSGCVLRS